MQAGARIAGLKATENKEASSNVKPGYVISTSPDNGNSAPKGSTVTVNVSSGIGTISLPNVTGDQASSAQSQLQAAGFTHVTLSTDSTSTQPSGEVFKQSPSPGKYSPDTPITLYESGGGIKVFDVTNQNQQEAMIILQDEGFSVKAESIADAANPGTAAGTVYNQTPAAGTVQPKGTQITIFVQPEATASATPTPTASATPTDTSTPTVAPSTPTPTGTEPTTGGDGGGISTQAG